MISVEEIENIELNASDVFNAFVKLDMEFEENRKDESISNKVFLDDELKKYNILHSKMNDLNKEEKKLLVMKLFEYSSKTDNYSTMLACFSEAACISYSLSTEKTR